MVTEAQREAHSKLQENIGKKQQTVFQVIGDTPGGATLFTICNKLNWPVNRVSGRVSELKKKGLIEDSGRKMINPSSGKNATVWIVA